MARYIDADKLIAHLKDEIEGCKQPFGSRANGKSIAYGTELGLKSAISFVETLATTDVVPKSEVEQIKWERDVAIKQLEEIGLSFGEKTDGYGNLTEYAKQIFEKIEKALNNSVETEHFKGTWFNMSKFRQRIAELKKKYTESEDKG